MNDVRHQLCVLGGVFAQVRPTPVGGGTSSPGGRGALCAIGAARLGADVELVGVVGDDDLGSRLRADLIAEGVCVEALLAKAGTQTERRPVPVPGEGGSVEASASAQLAAKDVDVARGAIVGSMVLLVSQDVPQAALERAVEIARRADRPVVLRAALGVSLADEWLGQLDTWIGTPVEARAFLELEEDDDCSPGGLARRIAAQGPRWVALWLGAADSAGKGSTGGAAAHDGAVLFDGERVHSHPGFGEGVGAPVALDAFTAAFCLARLEDLRPMAALRLAVAAAALGPEEVGQASTQEAEASAAPAALADAARLPRRTLVERRIAAPEPPLPQLPSDSTAASSGAHRLRR